MPATFDEWLNEEILEHPLMTESSINYARRAWDAAIAKTKLHVPNSKEDCQHVWLKFEGMHSHETLDLRKQACADDGCYGMWDPAEAKADRHKRRIEHRPPDRPIIKGKGHATG